MTEPESPVAAGAEEVWFAYSRDSWVLKGVSLAVPKGSIAMIMGPSGAGKTTLLKVLGGFLRPQKGRVTALGQDIGRGVPPGLRRRIGYIPQQLGLVRNLTALDNVLMGSLGRRPGWGVFLGLFPRDEVDHAMTVLEVVGIGHKAHEKVFRLSGGERQRVAIARTLLQRPRLVLADEFVSDLDLPRASEMLALMRQAGGREGITFVMNMHEVQLVREFGDQAFLVRDGAIVYQTAAGAVDMKLLQEAMR